MVSPDGNELHGPPAVGPRGFSRERAGLCGGPRVLTRLSHAASVATVALEEETGMSNGTFVLVLAAGAGLLALWLHVRFPSLAPERLGRTILHAATAFALLRMTSMFGESTAVFTVVFVFVLPALVYALLCTIWVLQHAQTALGLSR